MISPRNASDRRPLISGACGGTGRSELGIRMALAFGALCPLRVTSPLVCDVGSLLGIITSDMSQLLKTLCFVKGQSRKSMILYFLLQCLRMMFCTFFV